jgi:hypothetical protein
MGSMVAGDRGEDHRAGGHSCVVLPAEACSHFRPMARPAPALYRGAMRSAVRSFLVEPRAPDPPAPLWRDWVLVAALVAAGLLEAILREDLVWPGVALVAGVAPALCLPWRRTRPVHVTAVVFGSIMLGDAATLLGTGEPMERWPGRLLLHRSSSARDRIVDLRDARSSSAASRSAAPA